MNTVEGALELFLQEQQVTVQVCNLCGQTFSSKSGAYLHLIRRHTPQETVPTIPTKVRGDKDNGAYRCKFCGVWCHTQEDLKTHRETLCTSRPVQNVQSVQNVKNG